MSNKKTSLIDELLKAQGQQSQSPNYDKDDAYKTLDRVNFWLNNFDSKASYLLASIGIIGTILFTTDYFKCINLCIWSCPNLSFNILFLLILLSFLSTIIFLILSIKPRARNYGEEDIESKNHTILFYASIANFQDEMDELRKVKGFSEESIIDDINNQAFVCSKICEEKRDKIKKACYLIIVSLSLLFVFEILKHL